MTLNETAWEGRLNRERILAWLGNFSDGTLEDLELQRLHALFLLSQFIYFGSFQMRELLKALYRDLYKYPVVEEIRKKLRDTVDADLIAEKFALQLKRTRFIGIGNPSESGCHLLYFFRQENRLSPELFILQHQIFRRNKRSQLVLRYPTVKRYVFIDDLCGTGEQGRMYAEDILAELKAKRSDVHVSYLVLFGTTRGLNKLRMYFDHVDCVVELDDSFRCFGPKSRYFKNAPPGITRALAQRVCAHYGRQLLPGHALGYKNSQLLLGMHHNVPDNTLPIIWYSERDYRKWIPVFRRYPKLYDGDLT